MADYELLQPFEQLGRETHALTEAEQQAKAITRWNDLVVPTGKVLASWAQTKMTATDISRKTFTVGYDYFLSKRTDVYVMAMNDRITNQTKGNSFGVGIRHRF